jgi:hypothetical protein
MNGETIAAIASALSGGVLVKLVERHYEARGKSIEAAASLRAEYHQRVIELMEEVKAVNAQADQWQAKYYALFEENCRLKVSIPPKF